MSLKRSLVGLFRSYESSSDRAKDPKLKTHYYQLSKDKAWAEVTSTLKKMQKYKVLHEVQSVGEITLEKRTASGRTMDITVSVISVGPTRTAVDVYSASRGGFGDLGSNYRVVMEMFNILDKKMKDYVVSG